MSLARASCLALDLADPLAHARSRFVLPDGVNYLDGNSLGARPKGVAERVAHTIEAEWGEGLIRSWNEAGWYDSPGRIGAKLAPLLGAAPHQVVVTDTISVNLFKLLVAAARMRPGRKTILAERGNFPSDNHIVESVARMMGLTPRFVAASEIANAIDEDTAVVELSHVSYRTAEIQNMAAITKAAHHKGALIVWDLAHSSGAVELHLDRDRADFAVGCGYKFLNGGPGAPAHVYVAERHLESLDQPLTGWFAHAAPFAFGDDFQRAGRHPRHAVLDAADALDGGFRGRARCLRRDCDGGRATQGQRARRPDDCAGRRASCPLGVGIASLRDGARRGNHVSLTHPEGFSLMQALIARGVIGDFRAPDVMRFGFAPLYVRYVDVFDAVVALEDILKSGAWREMPLPKPGAVT